jgi:hypothetical protein
MSFNRASDPGERRPPVILPSGHDRVERIDPDAGRERSVKRGGLPIELDDYL